VTTQENLGIVFIENPFIITHIWHVSDDNKTLRLEVAWELLMPVGASEASGNS
jgi:hypothetical protein